MNLKEYINLIYGSPYKPGGMNPKEGLGSFSISYLWLQENMKVPYEYHGMNIDNRRKYFDSNPRKVTSIIIRFFSEYLNKVLIDERIDGDILIVNGKVTKGYTPVVYVGDNNILISTPIIGKVEIVSIKDFEIKRAYRIPKNERIVI